MINNYKYETKFHLIIIFKICIILILFFFNRTKLITFHSNLSKIFKQISTIPVSIPSFLKNLNSVKMAQTRDLLLRIASDNNLPVARIQEVIQKLEDEWYSEVSTLQEITESQWKTLGIPSRIVGLIKKYLSEDPSLQSQFRVSSLDSLVRSLPPDSQELRNCISILQTILKNLVHNPQPRYTVLKQSNAKFHEAVGRLPQGQHYLRLLGFSFANGEFQMPAINTPVLEQALDELNTVAERTGIPPVMQPEKFNLQGHSKLHELRCAQDRAWGQRSDRHH